MKLTTTFLPMFVLLLAAQSVVAQNPTGALQGRVMDGKGSRIVSAAVSMQSAETSYKRDTVSDGLGEFRLHDLPPGAYRVTVEAKGFAIAHTNVTVNVSATSELTVSMRLPDFRQTVSVASEASSITTQAIDSTSVVQQGTVTTRDLQTIPLASRSFANIAYLVPGTEPVEPSDPTKARITAVSFGGSSGLNVELSVDGGDNSDDYIGGFLQSYSPDTIQEFTVRTAQMDADTGRTTGGSVVISTKRGTDEWHSSAAFYERAAALNARFPIDNPAPNPKQPFSRQNYIGTLGGPIAKGKLWFFSSLEYVHERASIAYSPSSLSQFNALASLASQGLLPSVSSISVPTSVPVPFSDILPATRLDWAQSTKSSWFLRAALDHYTTQNDLVEQATLPSTGAKSRSSYVNVLLSQQETFTPTWTGSLVLEASGLRHTEKRNQYLGYALAFPFSSTSNTISGFETFGDNQFVTPITAFPVLREQEKYQARYDLAHDLGRHSLRWGVNVIHEPVLSGALSGTAESLTTFRMDPADYLGNPQQFAVDLTCTPNGPIAVTPGTTCSSVPAGDGSFSQNVQRLGLYAQDQWRITSRLAFHYGLRYDTTFGLFKASGRSQLENPAYLTLQMLSIPLVQGAPHDYRHAFAPRLGIAYSLGSKHDTVVRAGFGLFYNDMAQNGWVTAFQAVNTSRSLLGPCAVPGDTGCIPGGGSGALIDPNYKTPYAIDASAGIEHEFKDEWVASVDYTREQGVHGYRRYQYEAGFTLLSPQFPADVPNITLFRSDNRSSYQAMTVHLQGNLSRYFNLTANYTLASAKTWGCVLGELSDYVNGVCNPLNAFAKGDYGPSGEDIRHRLVLAGTFYLPKGFQVSILSQNESARPLTLITPVDVNGFGDKVNDRAIVNGVQTALDQFRGTPFLQTDLRVSRPFTLSERWSVVPFIEFFNLFNRNNPGANYVTNLAALPTPVNDLTNATAFCLDSSCTTTRPITNPKQLLVPAGALGDFFGPGTTVGIPFAAQLGIRMEF